MQESSRGKLFCSVVNVFFFYQVTTAKMCKYPGVIPLPFLTALFKEIMSVTRINEIALGVY